MNPETDPLQPALQPFPQPYPEPYPATQSAAYLEGQAPSPSEWLPEYSVRIAAVDAQHRQIFEQIRHAQELVRERREGSVLARNLRGIINLTRLHFAAEELLMQTFEYPEAQLHQLEHEWLTLVVLEFLEQFANGQEYLAPPLLDLMEGWLIRHILETDQRYSRFFAERGAIP